MLELGSLEELNRNGCSLPFGQSEAHFNIYKVIRNAFVAGLAGIERKIYYSTEFRRVLDAAIGWLVVKDC